MYCAIGGYGLKVGGHRSDMKLQLNISQFAQSKQSFYYYLLRTSDSVRDQLTKVSFLIKLIKLSGQDPGGTFDGFHSVGSSFSPAASTSSSAACVFSLSAASVSVPGSVSASVSSTVDSGALSSSAISTSG